MVDLIIQERRKFLVVEDDDLPVLIIARSMREERGQDVIRHHLFAVASDREVLNNSSRATWRVFSKRAGQFSD